MTETLTEPPRTPGFTRIDRPSCETTLPPVTVQMKFNRVVGGRSKIFAVKLRPASDLSGSAIIIFGQEQGRLAAAGALFAEVAAAAREGELGAAPVTAGFGRGVMTEVGDFATVGGAEVVVCAAVFVTGGIAGAGATIGIFPVTVTNFVFVLPQIPQLSSTRAVMEYVPGNTPFRSH